MGSVVYSMVIVRKSAGSKYLHWERTFSAASSLTWDWGGGKWPTLSIYKSFHPVWLSGVTSLSSSACCLPPPTTTTPHTPYLLLVAPQVPVTLSRVAAPAVPGEASFQLPSRVRREWLFPRAEMSVPGCADLTSLDLLPMNGQEGPDLNTPGWNWSISSVEFIGLVWFS